MELSECLERLRNFWPLAYADCDRGVFVRLSHHLASSAKLLLELFADEMEILELSTNLSVSLRCVACAAALLHDLGKASTYYLDLFASRAQQRRKLAFPLHEYVSGALLEYSAYAASERDFKLAARLAARVVARHHSAMRGRNPAGRQRELGRALRSLAIGGELVDELKSWARALAVCCDELVEAAVEASRALRELLEAPGGGGITLERYLRLDSLGGALAGPATYKAVTALTGYLMVADNLTADRERRVTDDELSPLFVADWTRELSYKYVVRTP